MVALPCAFSSAYVRVIEANGGDHDPRTWRSCGCAGGRARRRCGIRRDNIGQSRLNAPRGALIRTQNAETSSEEHAVADWSLIAQNAIVAVGRKFPGEAAVYMGIVHAAIYDAVVAIKGGYRPYAVTPTVPANTSVEAAVATAAHRVLVGRFGEQEGALNDLYDAYMNAMPATEAKANGIVVGDEVGAGMLLLRANDGLDSNVPYVQLSPGPGVYEPTAPVAPLGTRMPHVCRWRWRARLSSGPTAPLPYIAGITHETSAR